MQAASKSRRFGAMSKLTGGTQWSPSPMIDGEDAARRDFTMNALYADRRRAGDGFFRRYRGMRSVGRVRFIGDPATRIAEDALRILRFFRFYAYYGRGPLDPDGHTACARLATAIDNLSGERVRDELVKLLAAPDPAPVWREMEAAGIAARVARQGFVRRHAGEDRRFGDSPRYSGRCVAPPRGAFRTGPVVLGSSALKGPAEAFQPRRRASVGDFDDGPQVASVAERRFGQALYRFPPGRVRDAAMLAHVRTGVPNIPTLKDFLVFIDGWREPRFPLTGDDVLARGVPASAMLGVKLAEVEDWWRAADFSAQPRCVPCRTGQASQGHVTSGGSDIRIASTLPPVFSPNVVPRSWSRLNST